MSESSIASRRTYDNRARQEKAAQTRERIVAAGSELVHDFDTWNWRDLTFKAVAERAGVGERTVYRHFPTERHLHDAVMAAPGVRGGHLLRGRRPDQPRARSPPGYSRRCNGFRCANPLRRRRTRRSSASTCAGATRSLRAVPASAPGWSDAEQRSDGGPSRRAVEPAHLRATGRGVGHRRDRRNPRDRLADGQGRCGNRGRRPASCVTCLT